MPAGGRLVGRYRLLDLIGAGDMGVVWRAADDLLGRTVAVKRIGPAGQGQARAERARQLILREGRIAAMLDHPRLLRILDGVLDAGEPWLVLEYVAAPSWASQLLQRGPCAPGEAAAIAAQVCEALVALHRAGVVHGDVTPQNVLVGVDGQVRLADFGVAHLVRDATGSAMAGMTGFGAHRAPEVLAGAPPGTAADVFALGVAVYEAVEGSADEAATRGYPVLSPRRAGALTPVLVELLAADPARRPDASQARAMFMRVAAECFGS